MLNELLSLVNNATRNPTTIKTGKEAFVKDAVQVVNAIFVQIRD